MNIVAIAKIADSQQIHAFNKLFICIILSIRPISLTVEFVSDDIKLIFSMSNMNIIVNTKLQPNNSLHSSNQTK